MAVNLGTLSDEINAFDDRIAAAESVVKDLKAQQQEKESQLLAEMEAAGTDMVKGKSSVSVIEDVERPRIEDPDKFATFVLRNKALHLFERRIAQTAYREMIESRNGKPIPGLSVFRQRRLKNRKAK